MSVEALVTLPATVPDVGEMLVHSLSEKRATNQHCSLIILESLKYLARQEYAIRGHEEIGDGNLFQLEVQNELQYI